MQQSEWVHACRWRKVNGGEQWNNLIISVVLVVVVVVVPDGLRCLQGCYLFIPYLSGIS